ncbi:MAG: tetratricopeptide repeat protein [Planctomycetota bacterium]
MRHVTISVCTAALLLLPLASCAGLRGDGIGPVRAPGGSRAASTDESAAGTVEASAPVGASATEATAPAPQDDAFVESAPLGFDAASPLPARPSVDPTVDLSESTLWTDPAFRRRLVESYVAVSEVEPPLFGSETEKWGQLVELLYTQRMEEAEKFANKQRGPAASAAFDFVVGNLHFQRDELDEAEADFLVAIEKYPNFRRAWSGLAQIYARRNDYANTVRAFTKVIEMGGGDALTYGLVGVAYTKLQEYVAAESAFRTASMLDPDSVGWKVGLGEALTRQRRFGEAIALYDSLIRDQPGEPKFWLAQAMALVRSTRTDEAVENLEMVDALGGSTPQSLALLGDIYTTSGLYDLAADAYVRAIDANPVAEVESALRQVAGLAQRNANVPAKKVLDHVEEVYAGLLEIPDRKEILRLEARVAMALGDPDGHVTKLQEIIDLDPSDGGALILMGDHYARTEEPERAAFYYERAADLDGFEAEAKLHHGQMLVRARDYAAALPLVKRAAQLDERDFVQRLLEQVERSVRD